jgi:peptide/nickel transport system permease protein
MADDSTFLERPFSPVVPVEDRLDDLIIADRPRFVYLWQRFSTNTGALGGLVIFTLIVLVAFFAPWITPGVLPNTPGNVPFLNAQEIGPSLDQFPVRLFGTTTALYLHRSVLAQVAYGARASLILGLAPALISAFIGTMTGAISGYFGGWVDDLIMRITDVFLALPFLPLVIAIIVASSYNSDSLGVWGLVAIFSLVAWAGIARLVRANFLMLRQQEYIEAARAAGVGHWRIIYRHLLPNAITPVIVATVSSVATFIIAEATLDFLQLGASEPGSSTFVTWGNMISLAQSYVDNGNWWWVFFPGFFIFLTVMSLNAIGEGLHDVLDVRSRH